MGHQDPPPDVTTSKENLIGSVTTLVEVVDALAKRDCPDLTSSINLSACSEFPRAGGGYCDVYRGALHSGVSIAIKSLRVYDSPEAGGDSDRQKVLKRAARELYHWSKLQHCNVLPLIGFAVFRGQVSMISEWMEYGDLASFLKLNPDTNRSKFCVEICEGLCYIHANEMVHGDLKAANVMVSPDGTAMIADFGNARLKDLTLKFSNTGKGGFSVRWTAPELLVEDNGPQGTKEADVYAYGMTALEVLTGKVPYEEMSDNRVIFLIGVEKKLPPRPNIDICDDLWDLLNWCWARESSERPTIASVRVRLQALFWPSAERRSTECIDSQYFPPQVGEEGKQPSGGRNGLPKMVQLDVLTKSAFREPKSTTPPGSPPISKFYPLTIHMGMPRLVAALLPHLSFRDWNALNALNAGLRRQLEETRVLREEVLEYWLRGVGYSRWVSPKPEGLPLSLRDLNAYIRGVSFPVYRYSAIAESFLAIRAQQEQTNERNPGAGSNRNLVRALASSCRAYTKVTLRLREQAESMHRDGDFRSPLFRPGHAPLLRVFVPSEAGAWLSDASVLACEKELKRAGAIGALRNGDVVWDVAVSDEGNAGRMFWDGYYLIDLDYKYSTTGELPTCIHSLAFPPPYWHKAIRMSDRPLCHFDLAPYAVEIAQNLQLVQDRVQTETPQGGRYTVVHWVHRSWFHPHPGMRIPATSPPIFVDRMWEGIIVVEVEGTNAGLADLQARIGPGARLFPAKTAEVEIKAATGKSPFRLLRSKSLQGQVWIQAVREEERLM